MNPAHLAGVGSFISDNVYSTADLCEAHQASLGVLAVLGGKLGASVGVGLSYGAADFRRY